ncbi:MAG: cyclic nucleotide-binding domain-containing protein [Planctomycetes bacterium]|nr:cyclic nucleotide-binding domain-containing protein [Planctomycetota bacterium]
MATKMPTFSRLAELFRRLPVFHGVTDEEIERLLKICHSTTFLAGEAICAQGEPSDRMFICLAGEVEIRTDKAGVIHVMRPVEVFGEMGVVTEQPRSASAVAKTDCTLLMIHKRDFDVLILHSQRIGMVMLRNIAKALSQRLADANAKVEALTRAQAPAPAGPIHRFTPGVAPVPIPPSGIGMKTSVPAPVQAFAPAPVPVPQVPAGPSPTPLGEGFEFPPDPADAKKTAPPGA